jgi:hypothetical protein
MKDFYVEKFKDSFILDVERLLNIVAPSSINSLTLKDLSGIRGDYLSSIGQLLIGKYRLILTWSKEYNGLSCDFSTTEELENYIKDHFQEAVYRSLRKDTDYIYILDISTSEDYGDFPWKGDWAKNLLNKQLSIFMPIIQKFIADAMTDTL